MPEAVLAAQGLAVRYGALLALDDATLEVRAGEMVGLVGPNGAGKSTLFRAALGLTRPESGTLRVLGQPVGSAGYCAVRPHIGYAAQKPPSGRFAVTVWEAVAMGRYGQAGVGRGLAPRDREAVHDALQRLGIAALAERPVQQLSGGQAQRVTIARALAQEPRLLLLDEPTASLDRAGQLDIAQLIGELHRERGIAVAIVTHSLEVARLCQRLYYFDRGQVRPLAGVEELPGYACT